MNGRRIAFRRVAEVAQARAPEIVRRWLPDGRREGTEWVCRNPTRADKKPGSFKVNLKTGKWGDFATGDKGGDVIGLAIYLFELTPVAAASKIADMLGIDPYE
jgi:hypothetical protein